MKIADLYPNRIVRFFYKKTERPVLCSMNWCGRHVGMTVFLLLLIGMCLRIGYRGIVERPDRDEMTYISWVKKMADPDCSITPEMLRALIYAGYVIDRLGGDVEQGLRCFNFACSFLWLCVMYMLGKIVFSSRKAGLVCLFLAAFNPYTIRMAGQVMREPLYLLVFSAGLVCAVQIVRGINMVRYAALLGSLTVLGVWSRVEGVEILILMFLAVVFRSIYILRSKEPGQWNRLVTGILLYLLTLGLLVTVLYLIYPQKRDIQNRIVRTLDQVISAR